MKGTKAKAVWLLAALPLAMTAQETRGTIRGLVTDPQGAAVAEARVEVTRVETNTTAVLRTQSNGYYEAPLLLPGNYRLSAEMPGFKKTNREGITLQAGGTVDVHLSLELGVVSESVSVTSAAPLVDTSATGAAAVLDNRAVMDFPSLWSNPSNLIRYAPGVQYDGSNEQISPHGTAASAPNRLGNGTGVGGNEFSIDGVPNYSDGRRQATQPPSEAVEEMRIEASNFDASSGHTTGVNVIVLTKSGTNALHGTLRESHRQDRWNAAPFFTKRAYYESIAAAEAAGNKARADALRGQPILKSGRINDYAATVGGPVVLPKIYNGRNKLFFFGSFAGYRIATTGSQTLQNRTVPTLENRQGNFSQLLNIRDASGGAAGTRYQIYDPLSARADASRPGHLVRTPFSGNIIPQARIGGPIVDPFLKLLPAPNNNPADPSREPTVNYIASRIFDGGTYWSFSDRADYNINDRNRLFFSSSFSDWVQDAEDWTYETVRGIHTIGQHRKIKRGLLDHVYTLNASTILHFSGGATEYLFGRQLPVARSYKPSDFGLPKYVDDFAGEFHSVPTVNFGGYDGLGKGNYQTDTRYRVFMQKADLTMIHGSHTIKTGLDFRQHNESGGGGGTRNGSFTFNNVYTRRTDDDNTAAQLGHSFAAFLLGLPTTSMVEYRDSYIMGNPYYAVFVSDSWRVNKKLTLSLGLRMEYERGPVERFDRMIAGFDPEMANPVANLAQQAYAASPISEVPPSQFRVRGGTQYAGAGGSRQQWGNELMWLPKIGFACQLDPRTVVRGGYGISYDTLNVINAGLNQTGYSISTESPLSNDNGLTFALGNPQAGVSPLSDPFPVRFGGGRFLFPVGNMPGAVALLGADADFPIPDVKHARQHRYRLGVQRELGRNTVVEAAYNGSYSSRVYVDRNLNFLPAGEWNFDQRRTAAADANASRLTANVNNPFQLANLAALQQSNPSLYGYLSGLSFVTGTRVARQRLIRPYPNQNNITRQWLPDGLVRQHAIETSIQRRLSRGLQFNAYYAWSGVAEALTYLNEFDASPVWLPSNNARPHRFAATGLYELPFGSGRAWLSRGIPGKILGGFQLAATFEHQPGELLRFGNVFFAGSPDDVRLDQPGIARWFNTSTFVTGSGGVPAQFQARSTTGYFDGLRVDSATWMNASVSRTFRITERWSFELRGDAQNLLNHTRWGTPDMNANSARFGQVTTTTGSPRTIQLQGRIRF